MILFDQVISGLLWFGLVLAAAGMDAALGYAERLKVWYRGGGKFAKEAKFKAEIAETGTASDVWVRSRKSQGTALTEAERAGATWFGRLRKPWIMMGTTLALLVGFLAHACLAYAAWYPWAFFDATHTDTYGIVAYSFLLGNVLLTVLYAPLFYWTESVIGGLVNVVLGFLVAAVAGVMLALLTWLDGSVLITDVSPFVTLCVYAAYELYQIIYHAMLYAADEQED